jgi:hypothetical protein
MKAGDCRAKADVFGSLLPSLFDGIRSAMKTNMNLLVIACGGTKIDMHGQKVPALDLYAGRQFSLARAMFAKGWSVLILSAKYGLIDGERRIADYDQQMTRERADELAADDLQASLLRVRGGDADQIVFYGGGHYRRVFDALIARTGLARVGEGKDVTDIIGAGCGEQFSVLKEIVAETPLTLN